MTDVYIVLWCSIWYFFLFLRAIPLPTYLVILNSHSSYLWQTNTTTIRTNLIVHFYIYIALIKNNYFHIAIKEISNSDYIYQQEKVLHKKFNKDIKKLLPFSNTKGYTGKTLNNLFYRLNKYLLRIVNSQLILLCRRDNLNYVKI